MSSYGPKDKPKGLVQLARVKRATPKRLSVLGKWYSRDGRLVSARSPGGRFASLSDPLPDVVKEMELQEKARKRAASDYQSLLADQAINRRVAADWLADTTDTEVILETVHARTLDEVHEALKQAGIV